MSTEDLRAQREKIERQILELELTLGSESNSNEQLFSDSCPSEDGTDGNESQPEDLVTQENLEAERQQIQREIEELELTLGPDAFNAESQSDEDGQGGGTDTNHEDSADELDLPQNTEMCLQINLVYQEVLKDKLEELERLLTDNQQQQKEIMTQLSSTGTPQATTPGQPSLKVFLGSFLKPYFRDKLTNLGPPPNPETREIMNKRVRPLDQLKMRRWEGWQRTLLINAIVNDSMKRMIQPKMSKVEYLTQKMTKAENFERQILQKQIAEIEREIETISDLKENELMGGRYDDHDWQKISNIDFEGIRESEEIQSFWQNYLHPSINKTSWKDDEIQLLKEVAERHMHCNWDQIAEELGTNRTAFMCLQTYQRYICSDFRRRNWNSQEDKNLRELVEKMRIGNFIPYTQISYFMEGRDSMQLMYRWTQVLDPTLKKGYWSKEEDEMLLGGVAKYGVGNWWKIRKEVPGRTDGQCRDRYLDVLIGNVKKGPFDKEEKALLRRLVEKYGCKWAKIASEMPNRLDCQVLNQWRRMTGYKRDPRRQVRRKKALPKRTKVTRQKENEDLDSDLDEDEEEEEENIEYMDTDSETEMLELTESNEVDEEIEEIEVYNQPDMEQWLPVPDKVFQGPGILRALMVERPSQDGSVDQQEQAATESQQSAHKFMGVRSTILDHLGNPVSTFVGKDPPILSKKDYKSDMAMFKACYGEVRSFIQWRKSNRPKQKTNISMSDDKATSTSPSRPKVSSGNTETHLNYNLQLAVLPWVGNVLMPPPLPSKRPSEADMLREKASSIGLTNTPVFLLFLQVLRVDSQGCKQIIKMRNEQAAILDTQQAWPSKPMQKKNRKTVYRKEKEKNQSCQQQNSQLVTIPQTMVVTCPVVQSTPSPAVHSTQTSRQTISSTLIQSVSSSPNRHTTFTPRHILPLTPIQPSSPTCFIPSKPVQNVPSFHNRVVHSTPGQQFPSTPCQTMLAAPAHSSPVDMVNGQASEKPLANKRIRKPTEKACAYKDSLDQSPKRKKVRTKSSSKVPLVSQPNLVQPTPQCTFVLTPSGLMPISGTGFQMTCQNLPAKTVSSPVIINQQVPLSLNAVPSALTSCSTTIIGSTAPRITVPVDNLRETKPVIQSVVTAGPQLSAVSPVLSGPLRAIISTPLLPHSAPLQTLVLTVPSGSQSSFVPQRALDVALPNSPNPATQSGKSRKVIFDPKLMFTEDPSKVRMWLSGKNGVTLPELDVTLPYLPPFVSNLSTLSALLKNKPMLAANAKLVLTPEEKMNRSEEEQIAAVRSLVSERFSHNPGYLLLKARFLSCFTMPAFLATVDVVKHPKFYSEEEETLSKCPSRKVNTGCEEPKALQAPLLSIDGTGAPATSFSGIITRKKSLYINKGSD